MSIISRFLGYVEIRTKIASFFPYMLGLSYILYSGYKINVVNSLVYFFGMFCFDLTVTSINNYCDSKKNNHPLQFKRPVALSITISMLIISTVLGLYLFYLTDVFVLILGAICFFVGIIYSYGPVPLNHQAYSEPISGILHGFFIPIIFMYVNDPSSIGINFSFEFWIMQLGIDILPFLSYVVVSILPICLVANIMLANNICDVPEDIKVKRFTLPFYIGVPTALKLYAVIYAIGILSIVVGVVFGVYSPLNLLVLLVVFPLSKNIKIFFAKQEKKSTFGLTIKNFIMVFSVHVILTFLSCLIK